MIAAQQINATGHEGPTNYVDPTITITRESCSQEPAPSTQNLSPHTKLKANLRQPGRPELWAGFQAMCLACAGSPREVRQCANTDCRFYVYRLGSKQKQSGPDGKQLPQFSMKAMKAAVKDHCDDCLCSSRFPTNCASPTCPTRPLRLSLESDGGVEAETWLTGYTAECEAKREENRRRMVCHRTNCSHRLM